MAVSNIRATFGCEPQRVWDTVTSLSNYAWRSDLGRIEVQSETQFKEFTKDGFATSFTITACEPMRRWEFDMENSNMSGHWTGLFSYNGGCTELDFTENVTAKKLIMKPFVGLYLKKQQKQYIADLRKALK